MKTHENMRPATRHRHADIAAPADARLSAATSVADPVTDSGENSSVINALAENRVELGRLVAEHRLLKEAIEKSPMSFCVYDGQDRLIASNWSYERLHPLVRQLRAAHGPAHPIQYADLVREQVRDSVPDDKLEAEVQARVEAQRRADGRAIEREYADGVYRIVKYGLSSGSAGVAFDITELKHREAELTEARGEAETASAQAREALEAERARERWTRYLFELGEWLQSCKSLDELFRVTERFMSRLFPDSSGELYVYSNSRDVLDAACQWNCNQAQHVHIQPDDCWALRRGRLLRYGAGLVDLACHHARDLDAGDGVVTPYICIPIVAHGDTVGLLHIRFACPPAGQPSPLEEQTVSLAIQCAAQISLAIANAQLRDEMERQSTRDPLTGLYNRRHFTNECRKALAEAAQRDRPVSLVALDIDKFKSFNDQHGHDAGDSVLVGIAEMMLDFVTTEETVCRQGGEEFLLLIPGADLDAAVERADQLRRRVAGLVIRYGNINLPKLTISCGVATAPANGMTAQDMLRAADRALYAAKNAGRNRVCCAED